MRNRRRYSEMWIIAVTALSCLTTAFSFKFIVEPQDTIVQKGSAAVLNCVTTTGQLEGKPRISWKKDNSLLTFISDVRSPGEEIDDYGRSILANGSLQITEVIRTRESRPDEGLYQCRATLDGVGTILSRFAKLQAASLSRIDEGPEDLTVAEGQVARFSCLSQGIPPPTVSWIKDDRPLQLNSRMIVLPTGSLEIRNVQSTDEGVYQCNSSNIEKFHLSKTGRLVINRSPERDIAPVFTAVPKSQTVVASQSVIMECSAVSYPPPVISWLKDGKTIELSSEGSRFTMVGEGNLKIVDIQDSDRGMYQCRATNKEDSVDVSAVLEVQVPPRIQQIPTNFYAYEKEDVELPCKILGRPTPTIHWYKNGELIIEGDYFQMVNGNNLKILGLVTSDSGMYQCFGTNPAGNIQSGIHLQVLKPGQNMPSLKSEVDSNSTEGGPSPVREVTAALIATRFVTLTWKPPSSPNGNITAYAIFYKEQGSDRERVVNTTKTFEELNVQGLLPSKRYSFRVVAYNEKGPGISSREVILQTLAEIDIPGPPRSVRALPLSSSRVQVYWDPPQVIHGDVQRYKVYYVEASQTGNGNGNSATADSKLNDDFEDNTEGEEDEDDYYLPKNGGMQFITVNIPEAIIDDLRTFTEYFVWVVAINQNGPGENSEQIRVQTLSDIPADTPHNVSVESATSTSVAVRWEPPPHEFQNGIITGYKIKYKQKGKKKAETLTTDGNTQFVTLSELERGTEYVVKLAAMNINGTGPSTEWIPVTTFQRDLGETQVPDKPDTLIAISGADSITIKWAPPRNTNTMVRGYTIGWGKGIPDVYTKLVEGRRRYFTISNLRPNSDYVISLRAYNHVGDGVPIYENVRTRDTSEEDGDDGPMMAQLPPPVGLRAIVLSTTSVVLYWTDTSLPKTQVVPDNRVYVVRVLPTAAATSSQKKTSVKYVNSTQLNTILDDLKPGTQYEFSVKVVKNRHSSEWSLVALNTTLDTALSPPEDLTLMAVTGDDGTSSVILNWQPPKTMKEDDMRGYMIFYTTKPSLKEWVEELAPEDVLTHRIIGLTADTTYYFRMAAKHSKGLGPYTEIKSVATRPSLKHNLGIFSGTKTSNSDKDGNSNQIVLYILIGLSVTFAFASVSLCIYYRKRGNESPEPTKKVRKPDLKPPDLWIHHDQMELKTTTKSNLSDTPLSPSGRSSSREFGNIEEKIPLQAAGSSLDKRNFMSSYLGGVTGDLRGNLRHSQTLRGDGSLHSPDASKTYDTLPSGSSTASSQHNLNEYSGSNLGTLGRRTGGGANLKSFAVPIPPGAHAPVTPQSKVVNPRPMGGVIGLSSSKEPSSPIKRISTSHLPMKMPFPECSPSPNDLNREFPDKCLSTEELSQEISNLEGLMKDLNAITASEFQC